MDVLWLRKGCRVKNKQKGPSDLKESKTLYFSWNLIWGLTQNILQLLLVGSASLLLLPLPPCYCCSLRTTFPPDILSHTQICHFCPHINHLISSAPLCWSLCSEMLHIANIMSMSRSIWSRDHSLFLQHIPSLAARTLYQRSYRRVKLSLSWFSPVEVCGKASSLPSPTPQSQCWKCPRADPCCVAPCRTTAQPCCCCCCPGEAQLWHGALQILHPLCFLREKITIIAVFPQRHAHPVGFSW